MMETTEVPPAAAPTGPEIDRAIANVRSWLDRKTEIVYRTDVELVLGAVNREGVVSLDAASQWIREDWALPDVGEHVQAQDGVTVWYGGVNWYHVETKRTHLVTHWRPLNAALHEKPFGGETS